MNSNQFVQSVVQGQIDLRFSGSTISGQVDSSSAGGLIPGQAVKMMDTAGGAPKFVECSSSADDVFGFINLSYRTNAFSAGDKVEVSCMHGNVMYMTASGPIARNGKVMISGTQVAAATAGNTIVGRALDKATASGQLIRVIIDLPGLTA